MIGRRDSFSARDGVRDRAPFSRPCLIASVYTYGLSFAIEMKRLPWASLDLEVARSKSESTVGVAVAALDWP